MFEKNAIRGGPMRLIRALILSILYSIKLHRNLNSLNIDLIVIGSVRASLLLSVTRVFGRQHTLLFAQNSTPFGVFSALSLVGVDLVGLISSGSKTTFPAWMIKLYDHKLRHLASGRSMAAYEHVTRSSDQQTTNFVTICSITRRKGLHVLLSAFRLLQQDYKDVVLNIVGGTSGQDSEYYLSELESFCDKHELNVRFHGWSSDVVNHLEGNDVFVLASENEGLPGAIIEAMATGLPVITTDAGGCADAVTDGVNGYVVPVGDENALRMRMVEMLDNKKRQEFGRNSRGIAKERYTIEAFRERYLALVRELENQISN